MILTKPSIIEAVSCGDIFITGFDPSRCGPNSYDLTLNPKLLRYRSSVLDMDRENPTSDLVIPETGLVLMPGIGYIGSTNESASSRRYAPMLEGRSSVGRNFISVHATAGVGDIGFAFDRESGLPNGATWTLEISVIQPVRVYPNRRICQVMFFQGTKDLPTSMWYNGKYNKQMSAQASRSFEDPEARK